MNRGIVMVLDSGLGGLSIQEAIEGRVGETSFVYGADFKNFPYGPKSNEDVVASVSKLAVTLLQKIKPLEVDLLVVACNTASTQALEHLRSVVKIPVVGVVPAVKKAAELSQTKSIGVLCTSNTAKSSYLDDLMKKHVPGYGLSSKDQDAFQVYVKGSDRLAVWAEDYLKGQPIDLPSLESELKDLSEKIVSDGIDHLVLGCTHFPFLKELLQKTLPPSVHLIDSGEGVARRVQDLLKTNYRHTKKSFRHFYWTGFFDSQHPYLLKHHWDMKGSLYT